MSGRCFCTGCQRIEYRHRCLDVRCNRQPWTVLRLWCHPGSFRWVRLLLPSLCGQLSPRRWLWATAAYIALAYSTESNRGFYLGLQNVMIGLGASVGSASGAHLFCGALC
jgi:hypothetical protein